MGEKGKQNRDKTEIRDGDGQDRNLDSAFFFEGLLHGFL